MAGSISLSMSQQFDTLGKPLNGGKLYLYGAGTTTPQSAYQDAALTIALPNPITLDSAGRIPPFYLADGYIKVRLADSAGVVQVAADYVLVAGPSSGSGSAPSVDPTTIFTTGDLKSMYGTGSISGWVRLNGRTIGSATSGASERANADTQALFVYLWQTDANLSVSTGRGVSAAADWAANKTITLPDGRGRVLAGLDDMGNSAAGRLSASYFGATATTLGASGGAESQTLTTAQMPTHNHGVTDPGHNHNNGVFNKLLKVDGNGTTAAVDSSASEPNISSSGYGDIQSNTTGITINNAGSGGAHANVQPTILATIYLKL